MWGQGNRNKLEKSDSWNGNTLSGCNMLPMVGDGADILKRHRNLKGKGVVLTKWNKSDVLQWQMTKEEM